MSGGNPRETREAPTERSGPDDGSDDATGQHPLLVGLGPFYDEAGAARWLGSIARSELSDRCEQRTVLAMQTGDGTWLFPAWQFTGRGDVHPVLLPVLEALRELDRWSAAVWLTNGHPALGGRTPRRALAEGVDPDLVALLARQDVAVMRG